MLILSSSEKLRYFFFFFFVFGIIGSLWLRYQMRSYDNLGKKKTTNLQAHGTESPAPEPDQPTNKTKQKNKTYKGNLAEEITNETGID